MKLSDIDRVRRLAETLTQLKFMRDKPGEKEYTIFVSMSGSDKRIQVALSNDDAQNLIDNEIENIAGQLLELGVEP